MEYYSQSCPPRRSKSIASSSICSSRLVEHVHLNSSCLNIKTFPITDRLRSSRRTDHTLSTDNFPIFLRGCIHSRPIPTVAHRVSYQAFGTCSINALNDSSDINLSAARFTKYFRRVLILNSLFFGIALQIHLFASFGNLALLFIDRLL